MATGAKIGQGSEFHLGTGTGSTLTKLLEVIALSVPQVEIDEVEATSFDSNGFREYIPGLKDGGEITIEGNYISGNATDLLLLGALGASRLYKIVVPAATGNRQCTGSVVLKSYVPDIPLDDRMTWSATFKVSGEPVWAVAA